MSQRPIAVALLLCEQLIVDDQTQNVTPVNCFSRRVLDRPLEEPQSFAVFFLLTDALGTMPAELELVRLDMDEVIYRKQFQVRFDNPLQQLRCLLPRAAVRLSRGGALPDELDYRGRMYRSASLYGGPSGEQFMSHSPGSPSFPNHGGSSDSLDVVTLHIDGPTDLPLGPVHPAVKKLLDAEREKIQRWKAWLEQQGGEASQESRA